MSSQDKKSRANRLRRRNRIASVIPVVAFVIFAGITAFTVLGATNTANTPSIANQDGVPNNWATTLASVETTIEAKTISNSYVEYTVAMHNPSPDSTLTLTHLSSYVSGSGKEGFISLDGSNLEYSYFPDNNSWETLELSHPGNDFSSFRLGSALTLGANGSALDTIYFRYDVLPETSDGIIEDRVSALLVNDYGDAAYTTSSTSIAYSNMGVQIAEQPTADGTEIAMNDDGSYTKPLGVSHYGNDGDEIEIITGTASGNINSSSFIMNSLIFVAIGLGILILSYIIYIPISRKK